MSPAALAPAPRVARLTALALAISFGIAGVAALTMPWALAASAPYFGPNVKVSALPAYNGYQPSLAVGRSGTVYLAFGASGGSTTGADIFFAKSLDAGRTWSTPSRVNNDVGGATQQEPSLTLDSSDNIYIAWNDARGGTPDIYFAKSTDGGLSFSANVRVNDVTTGAQTEPDVAVDSLGIIHAIWTDGRNTAANGNDIFYANSTDGGASFNPSRRVNNDATTAEQAHPAIAVGPDRSVYAVWDDPRNLARGRDIYFSKSTDSGNTWSANIIVNDDVGSTSQDTPDIVVNPSGTIFVAWSDSRTANTAPDVDASRSTNGGASFAANVKVNDDAGATYQGSVALAAGPTKVQAIWTDTRTWGSTGSDIYTSSTTDGITWAANQRVNDDNLPANYQNTPVVGVDASGDVFAAWFDQRSSSQDVYAGTLDVVAPQARGGADQTVGQGVGVAFNASASTDNLGIASYSWDFGDGTRAVTPAANHAYTTPGSYVATLTVTDYSGNTNSASVHITVQDTTPPVARGGGDRAVDQGQPLFFDAGASTDNVGVTSYLWDFGDGTTSSLAAVSHTYATPGNYTVTLTVTDAAGNKDTVPMQVTVRTVSPTPGALLGMVQTLQAALALMGVALVVVGILAFLGWRQRRPPMVTVPGPSESSAETVAGGAPSEGGGPRPP